MTPEQKAEQKWNAQADQFNQWDNLSDDEKRELIAKEKPMNCPNCKRPLATDDDYENIPAGEGSSLCWNEMDDDDSCERMAQSIRESALSTIEILQAAIDEGCEVGIYITTPNNTNTINVDIDGKETFGCSQSDTLETAVAGAWQHYQTNKNQ